MLASALFPPQSPPQKRHWEARLYQNQLIELFGQPSAAQAESSQGQLLP